MSYHTQPHAQLDKLIKAGTQSLDLTDPKSQFLLRLIPWASY